MGGVDSTKGEVVQRVLESPSSVTVLLIAVLYCARVLCSAGLFRCAGVLCYAEVLCCAEVEIVDRWSRLALEWVSYAAATTQRDAKRRKEDALCLRADILRDLQRSVVGCRLMKDKAEKKEERKEKYCAARSTVHYDRKAGK